MIRHVNRLLAAYVDGQLSSDDASVVYHHLRSCRRCRARLAGYEQMSIDLRVTLNAQLPAHPADVRRWWQAISRARMQPARPSRLLMLAPALMVTVVLGLPLITSLSSLSIQPATASRSADATHMSTQLAANEPVAGLIPQPQQQDQSTAIVATAAPQENVVTAAPAPLAPSR
jgi:anti-sigma factor RsiW